MLIKFRGTNEAEPRKQCESLARARVAFSMFLATLILFYFIFLGHYKHIHDIVKDLSYLQKT